MAVFLAVRVVIALGGGARVVQAERSASGQPGADAAIEWAWHRLQDPAESDAALSALLSERSGTVVDVATYNPPFTLRKLQVSFSRNSGVVAGEDVSVITFHFIRVQGGAHNDVWDDTQFNGVIANFETLWTTLKVHYAPEIILKRLAFYKAGPAISPPQPPVFAVDRNLPGTAAAGTPMPAPQTALTVTERAGLKPHWGRIYFPAPVPGTQNTVYGRPTTTFCTALADAMDVFYESNISNGRVPVVYRPALPEREKKDGTQLPARAASAWTVDTIAVDDTYDVIRSRRWDNPTVRVLRGIGA